MQLFQVIKLPEYPYMKTKEIVGDSPELPIQDLFKESDNSEAYLMIDHDLKRIYTYFCQHCDISLQIYGGIIANKFRTQLRLFYRIYPLNMHKEDSKMFKEVMESTLKPGRAIEITEDDFIEKDSVHTESVIYPLDKGIKLNQALEKVNELNDIENFECKFLILGGNVYIKERIPTQIIPEKEYKDKYKVLGKLNDGFTFFGNHNYSTRVLFDKKILQGIEIYVRKDEKDPKIEINIPVLYDEHVSEERKIEKLEEAFEIPNNYSEE